MADTPLGKGLIEIGANLAPLEAGLAQAQAKTRAALGVSFGGGGGDQAATTAAIDSMRAKLAETTSTASEEEQGLSDSLNAVAGAEKGLLSSTPAVTTATDAAGKSAKTASFSYSLFNTTLKNVAGGVQQATMGFRAIVGSISSTIGAFTAALGIFGLVANAISMIVNALQSQKKAQEDARIAAEEANKTYTELADNRYLKEKTGIEKRIDDIDREHDRRIAIVNDVYNKQLAANAKLNDQQKAIKDAEAREEAVRSVKNIEKNRNVALQQLNLQIDKEIQATIEGEKKKNREIEKSLLGPREKAIADHADKVAEIEATMQKNIGAERADEMNAIHKQRIEFLNKELQKSLNDINKEEETKREQALQTQREVERAAKQFAEAQRASFAGLQNQINSLFNTGNMEVGINRVASLVQVLIDKTERR